MTSHLKLLAVLNTDIHAFNVIALIGAEELRYQNHMLTD